MDIDLELLHSISLATSQAREVGTVLQMVAAGLTQKAGLALARIWLLDKSPASEKGGASDEPPFLRLAASAGQSQVDGRFWNRLDGEFARMPIGVRKIGHIAKSRESLRLDDREVANSRWTAHPEWVAREGIKGFAGHPLLFRNEVLGVLGVFSREGISLAQFQWLGLFAGQAAVAIANARAFEEIEGLRERLELENEYLRGEVRQNFGGLVGQSHSLQNIFRQIELVAPTDANVLITGETGSGKELVARAIHEQSKRSARALVKVNCASVARELFESEFFGHARGAFTGAVRDRAGRFELASGGTLFLDEVGEIPMAMQGKLLRVLQEGEFERVGENRTRKVDVRVIAATNRNLREQIGIGLFREDLFFRLSVFPLEVPPLRARQSDIPLLAAHFLELAARRMKLPQPALTGSNIQALTEYAWPGNIRELQNVIERAVILSDGGPLQFQLAGPWASDGAPDTSSMPLSRTQWLRSQQPTIEKALKKSGGKIHGPDGAAALLGLRPTTLASRMAALGIKRR